MAFPWRMLLLLLLSTHAAFAQWDFTHAGDPNRNWGATVTESVGYDDNFNASEKDQEAGARVSSDVKLRANIPLERFFVGMQYDYTANYPQNVNAGGVDQSHNFNLSANYTANPRLSLGVTENFVSSLEPQLVQNNNTVVQDGTYQYNNLGASMNYLLSPRWTMSVVGSWDVWDYQSKAISSNNNHQDYSTTLSALYLLDTRTTVGLNYQYTQTVFDNPGIDNGLNAYSQTLYLSYTRRFNPRLSVTLNGGYTVRDAEDGSQSTSPSAFGSFIYNYGPQSTITLTLAQSLSSASVGVTGQFSAQQNSSVTVLVSHRVTARLRALASVGYVYSSFEQPLGGSSVNLNNPFPWLGNPFVPPTKGITVTPNDQSVSCHLGLNYAFRDWVSAVMDYNYTDLISSDALLVQPYTRNQISTGISLSY